MSEETERVLTYLEYIEQLIKEGKYDTALEWVDIARDKLKGE